MDDRASLLMRCSASLGRGFESRRLRAINPFDQHEEQDYTSLCSVSGETCFSAAPLAQW